MRVLATCTPGAGHINALAPLLAALRAAGHDVLVVTAAESVDYVARAGFAVRPGGLGVVERRKTFEPRLPEVMALPPRQRRGLYFSGFFADAAAPVMARALEPVFADFEPDVVIHETAELAAAPMATARGIPHATVAFSGSLSDSAQSLTISAIAPVWHAEGLPTPTPDDIRGAVFLHPFPPSFGQVPPGDRVRPMRALGFATGTDPIPDWLGSAGSPRPLVYMTAGTERLGATAPWAAGLAALGLLDVDAIATIGPYLDPAELGEVPANVRIERFVPYEAILERASLVMSHAGAGSLLGAARQGLPQLLYPMGADQWENADAASGAGVGLTCELDQRSTEDIAGMLTRLIEEPSFASAATQVSAEIAAMPPPADHVPTIEALVGSNGA
jgi:hypothetical protein